MMNKAMSQKSPKTREHPRPEKAKIRAVTAATAMTVTAPLRTRRSPCLRTSLGRRGSRPRRIRRMRSLRKPSKGGYYGRSEIL